MQKIIALISILVLAGCSDYSADTSFLRGSSRSLTHDAYYWIGLDERRDRQTIKEIMGVDPVTTEWCAAFVNMVLLENNLPTSSYVSPHPLTARSFLKWGEKVDDEPKYGDLLVFKRGNSGWQGHVGFYVSHKVVNGQVIYYVLGGNQGDKVSIEQYSGRKLLGIRRASPEYYDMSM